MPHTYAKLIHLVTSICFVVDYTRSGQSANVSPRGYATIATSHNGGTTMYQPASAYPHAGVPPSSSFLNGPASKLCRKSEIVNLFSCLITFSFFSFYWNG